MSDNVSNLKKARPPWKRILALALLISLVLAAVVLIAFRDRLNPGALRRMLRRMNASGGESAVRFSYDEHNDDRFADFSGGLAVASVTGLSVYDAKGAELSSVQAALSSPALRSNGSVALAYDAGGYRLQAVTESGGSVLSLTAERPILDADLSEDGCICYVSSLPGYKSVLCVYNAQQELIYRWNSASQYMPRCALSKGAKLLAAAALGQSDGMYESSVVLFRTDEAEPFLTVSLGNDLIYELRFVDEQTLAAVCESRTYFLNVTTGAKSVYDYQGLYLKDYVLDGSGFLTLLLNMYKAGNHCRLLTVDASAQELGSLQLDAQVLGLSAAGECVGVLSSEALTVYDRALTEKGRTQEISGMTDLVVRKDGTAILLGGGHGEIILP